MKKFQVSLQGAPTAIVAVPEGQDPFEVYRQKIGVERSLNRPQWHEVPADSVCGIFRADGTLQPFEN